MAMTRPTVVVTGASGDLGSRLVPLLADFNVVGLDWKQPAIKLPFRFIHMNLEREDCCRELMLLLRETRAATFVHLASVNARNHGEVMDAERTWQINVAGTARILEAITEANREEMLVKKFIFPSSTLVYGPNLTGRGRRGDRSFERAAVGRQAADRSRESDPQTWHRVTGLQHLYSSRPGFCRRQFTQLPGQRFSSQPKGQAAVVRVTLGHARPRKSYPVRPRGRHGPPDFLHYPQERT